MTLRLGPEHLPQFEDRVLYYTVELTGDRPMLAGQGTSEADLAKPLADELTITQEIAEQPGFHHSEARGTILAAVETLDREGLVDVDKVMGPWTIRPTREGRRRVAQWKEKWAKNRLQLDQVVQRRILEELDRQRRADPEHHAERAKLDVVQFCEDLETTHNDYLANAHRLVEQGKVKQRPVDQDTVVRGEISITEVGIRALEAMTTAERPWRDAQEAWVEVARLRRRLQLAERDLPSLIQDEELRRRCVDLLSAEGHYDRVIREACVILESRVRTTIGADKKLTAIPLMEQAFSPKGGPLELSDLEQEQLGAMQIYRGVMALFRNAAGHHIIDTYSQDDALRFVVWIDLLLEMMKTADTTSP